MTDINSLTIVGRLTRDCGQQDFSYTQNSVAVAKISIAVNRSKKQADGSYADEAHYFDVTIFGKTAENLKPYLVKGKQIVVQGHLQQERWQDQQGNNRSRVSIVADNIQLASGGQSQNGNGQNQQGYNPNTVYPTAQAAQQASAMQNPQQYAPPQGYQQQPNFGQAPQNQYQPQQNFPPPSEGFPEDIPF